MHAKTFIKIFFLASAMLLLLVASFTLFMDPTWSFSHSHRFNNTQEASNERIQKSNVLYFKPAHYDALLLGSSRVTFFNQFDFKNNKVYNYAFALAMPDEYAPYIHFAKKYNQATIKKIYIGMDFFATNKNFKNDVNAQEIFESIESCCYRYKLLFSIDSLKTALFSLKAALTNDLGYRSYKRNNVTRSAPRSKESIKKDVEHKKVSQYMGDISHYQFNPNFKQSLIDLNQENPEINIIPFTTPVSRVYLQKLFDLGHKDAYKQWLRTLVEIYGKVYHFMDFNTVTNNYVDYYIDYHHLYPRYTKWIVDRLEKRDNSAIPKDFGKVLTKANIEAYLSNL